MSDIKTSGAVYTPEYMVEELLYLALYTDDQDIIKKHVIDNSCGDGAFLCNIVETYCAEGIRREGLRSVKTDLETYIHGIDIDSEAVEKCKARLDDVVDGYGIKDVKWDVFCADTLTIDKYDGKMDYVFGNPPYVRVHNLGGSLDAVKGLSFCKEGMTDLYIAFFEIGLRMLSENGKLCYITPSSYFTSVAGRTMREYFVKHNLLDKVVDLKHYQVFPATAYTAITLLQNSREYQPVHLYDFDDKWLVDGFVDALTTNDYYINGGFYFGTKKECMLMRVIKENRQQAPIEIKHGYQTSGDKIYVHDFDFDSPYIIPAIKASTGAEVKIFYPYDENGNPVPLADIKKDEKMYAYLEANYEGLIDRDNDNKGEDEWHLYGWSQGISDTYKDKLSINFIIRDKNDLKIVHAPKGVGVYSGLYILSDEISYEDIEKALRDEEFEIYVRLLERYKSGGYYAFTSKDLKTYLDYKLTQDF